MSDSQSPLANQAAAIEALGSVSNLDGEQFAGVLLMTDLPDDHFSLSQLRPTASATPALLAVAQAALSYYRDCELIDYGPATSCIGREVMWLSLSTVPLLESIVGDSADLANIDLFDPRKAKLAKTRLTAMRVETDNGPVVFVQSVLGSQVVARSTKFGVLVKKGVIDLPKGDLLLLNRGVTAIIASGFIYFANRSAFQKLFKLLEELQRRAEATLREVTQNLNIDGFDQLLSAVSTQPAMIGKMASIQLKLDTYPQYKEALTMPKLLPFIRSHPECHVDLSGGGNDAKLVFRSDPQRRFKILKLLDDDLLRSELTTLEYEANSKSAPIG